MPTIKIEVKDKIAKNLTPEVEIVSRNGDYEIEFLFDSEWENSNIKTARFYYNFGKVDILFDGNICKVPELEETQLLKVGVFTDTQKTTTDAEIKCKFSIKHYGGKVHEPSKDIYGQIIDLLNKYIEQGSGVNREEVEQIIRDYLVENPIKDGFSPTVEIRDIENGTRVSITDINGTKSFDVLNGKDAQNIDIQTDGVSIVENGVANIPLANKLDKLSTATTNHQAYVKSASGQQMMFNIENGPVGGTICMRDGNGRLRITDPAQATECATKGYVDTNKGAKVYRHSWYGSGGEWGDVPEHIFSYLSFNGTPEEGLTPSNCEGRGITIINERKGFLAKNTLLHDIIGTSHTQNGLCFAILQYGNLNFESGFGSMPMSMFDTITDEVIEL